MNVKAAKIMALSLALCLTLTACGTPSAGNERPGNSPGPSVSAAPTAPDKKGNDEGVQVEEGVLTVEVTIPASFYEDEDMSAFDAERYASENDFKSAILNEDGSVTVIMTKKRHKSLMDDLRTTINGAFSEMIEAEDTPYIKEINCSDNYNQIEIVVNKDGYNNGGLYAAFIPLLVYFQGAMYQAFNGDEARSVISFVDEATGETFESVIYPDALEE